MSKADKMFDELGYTKALFKSIKSSQTERYLKYIGDSSLHNLIVFYEETREVELHLGLNAIYVKEHLAIHEKMKELGWIE